jgi:hypothetical protein
MSAEVKEDDDVWVNSAEVRRLCGSVSQMALYRWRARGFPDHLKWNGRNYWRKSEILNFRARLSDPAAKL